MMMNIKAIALLFCSLGTAVFFSPQPYLERLGDFSVADKGGGGGSLQLRNIKPEAAKHAAAAAGAFPSADDSVRKTTDEIRHAGESSVRTVGGAAGSVKESVQHCIGSAVTCMKGGEAEAADEGNKISGAGKEKVRELADSAKQTMEGVREKSASVYDSITEKASSKAAKETINDSAASAKESIVQLASNAFKKDESSAATLWKKAEKSRDEALQGVGRMRASLMQGMNLSEGGEEEQVARKVEECYVIIKTSFEAGALKIVEYVEAIKEAARETTKAGTNSINTALGLPPKQELTIQEFVRKKLDVREVGSDVTEKARVLFEDVKETIADLLKNARVQAPELGLEGKEVQFNKKQNSKEEVWRREEWLEEKLDEAGHEANETAGMMKGTLKRMKSMIATLTYKSFQSLVRLVYLFSFSTIYGTSLWVTFISGMILSQCTSKQQFGYLQSRIFPVYFRIMALGEAFLLLTHALLHPWPSADSSERWQYQNLFWSLFMTLLNIKLLEPLATKIMLERLKMEKEEGRGLQDTGELGTLDEQTKTQMNAVNRKFNRMHNYSSAANLASLACLTYHLWHLDRRLVI